MHLPGLALTEPLLSAGSRLGKRSSLPAWFRRLLDLRIVSLLYVPEPLLLQFGLSPGRLFALTEETPHSLAEARSLRLLTRELLLLGIRRCEEAWPYVLALPSQQVRLRLACIWPLLLALDTLAMLGDVVRRCLRRLSR